MKKLRDFCRPRFCTIEISLISLKVPFLTCENFLEFLLFLSVVCIVTFGATETAVRSVRLEYLAAVIALFYVLEFVILNDNMELKT